MHLISLSQVFNKVCLKVLDPGMMKVLKEEVAETMSSLEKSFPPAYLDVMTDLAVHIMEELDMCGLVHARWMCPMVRYMKALKRYIRSQTRLKGSMASRYAIEEALGFYIEYIQEVKSTKRRMWDDK